MTPRPLRQAPRLPRPARTRRILLTIELNPANTSDHIASVQAMDRLHKRFRDHAPSLNIDIFVADAGHDSLAAHEARWH